MDNMALNENHKKKIIEALETIDVCLQELEECPTDIRALDLLSVVISLLQEQVNNNVAYEDSATVKFADDQVPDDDDADEDARFMAQNILGVKLDANDFKLLKENDDMPSTKDLENWFTL